MFEEGIARFFIGAEVFSLKPVSSKVLAQSAVVKYLMRSLRDFSKMKDCETEAKLQNTRLEKSLSVPIPAPDTILSPLPHFSLNQPPSAYFSFTYPSEKLKEQRDN